VKEFLLQVIQKYRDRKLTISEQAALFEQLADPKNRESEQILADEWNEQLKLDGDTNRNFSEILDRVHHEIRLNESSRPVRLSLWTALQRIAAVLFLPLLLSFSAYLYLDKIHPVTNETYAEIQCPLGVRTKFQLPDGTTGFLNSGSTLKYDVLFTSERSVALSGEAYFDVVHNAEMPFHVNTRNLDIKVLGTTFNVLANENENTEEIVLQTGKVEVSDQNGKQLATMLPDDQLILDTEKQTFTRNSIVSSQYTSWKEGKLVFRNENMQQVARRLSRWYNAEVVVADRQLDAYTFHATFIDEPLDEVLKMISITTPISYREEKRTSDKEGIFSQRKIILRINKYKINQFK